MRSDLRAPSRVQGIARPPIRHYFPDRMHGFVLLVFLIAGFTPRPAASQAPPDRPRLVPMYRVTEDESVSVRHLAKTIVTLDEIRAWFAEQLNGKTFRYDPVVVRRGTPRVGEPGDDAQKILLITSDAGDGRLAHHLTGLIDMMLGGEGELTDADPFIGDSGVQYTMFTAFTPAASRGWKAVAFDVDSTVVWVDIGGEGAGYPWAVTFRPGRRDAHATYQFGGAISLAAELGVAEGSTGQFRVGWGFPGGWQEEWLIEAGDAPHRIVVNLRGRTEMTVHVQRMTGAKGTVVFGNPRVYWQ